MKKIYIPFLSILCLSNSIVFAQTEIFNYRKALTTSRTLSANISSINRASGQVVFGGADLRGPSTPGLTFTWIWGDGTSNDGYFPQNKTYSDVKKNYLVKVVSNYSATEKDTVEVLVDFVKAKLTPIALDPKLKVFIPESNFTFGNAATPPQLFPKSILDDESRQQLEYLLHVGATIEFDFINQDATLYNGKFEQYMVRDSLFPGAYALFYTKPVGFGVGDVLTKGDVDYSSLYHEIGHNLTLNSPASYNFGSIFAGQANSFFSESLAQIFQYSTGYEVINNYKQYGLDEIMLFKYKTNFSNAVGRLKGSFDEYVSDGMRFATWSKVPGYSYTESKDAFLSFLSIPYKFCQYAEEQGTGYRTPVKRFMQFLQKVTPEWNKRYDGQNDSQAGNAFRATMMVAAMSHAFQKDLRSDFRAINYPVSDTDWAFLNPEILDVSKAVVELAPENKSTATVEVNANVNWTAKSSESWLTINPVSGTGKQTITLTATGNTGSTTRSASITFSTNGIAGKTVKVTQAALSPTLAVSAKSLSLNAAEGSNATLDVTSNVTWNATSSQPWLTITPTTGIGNAKIVATATANPQFQKRTATITLKATGVSDQTVEVTQAAPLITGIELPGAAALFPNPVKDIVYIKNLLKKSKVDIFNMRGQLLKSIQVSEQTDHFSIREFPAGLYQIRVSSDARQTVFRIIKI